MNFDECLQKNNVIVTLKLLHLDQNESTFEPQSKSLLSPKFVQNKIATRNSCFSCIQFGYSCMSGMKSVISLFDSEI